MPCPSELYELMSLKLDGLTDPEDDHRLDEHLRTCVDCGRLWSAMKHADDILWASARQPVAVPSGFQMKVMAQIKAAEPARVLVPSAVENEPLFLPGASPALTAAAIATGHTAPLIMPTRRLDESPTSSLFAYSEWQGRVASYVRGIAAIGLSLAGTIGLLLALAISGTIKLSGPLADGVGTLRTFFDAIATWVGSLFANFGPGLVAVSAIMAAVLVLVGWQVVNGYHRAVLENKGNTSALEALA